MKRVLTLAAVAATSCRPSGPAQTPSTTAAPISREADRRMIQIPAGRIRHGSTPEERETAYRDYRATHGDDVARKYKWFEREADVAESRLPAYAIDRTPVTQGAYAEFVAAGGAAPPTMSAARWKRQGFSQDFETEVRRFIWKGGKPPPGRLDHPVVLVPWNDAAAYCAWRGRLVGHPRTLPSALEFEHAARGPSGSPYPWGDDFDASKLNSGVSGPRDTVSVESYSAHASAFGALDMAGNVFQWTRTPWPVGKNRMMVKGSAWDDFGGLGRAASGHGRPIVAAHAIVGFRCSSQPE